MLRSLRSSPLPADVRVELITLLFGSLQTVAIVTVPVSAIVVAIHVAWSAGTAATKGLAVATVAAVGARIFVILSFRFRVGHLTLATARRWAAAYGASAVAICGVMGLVTIEAFAAGGTLAYAPFGWCIATALGITACTATVPWIPVATGSVLLLPIAAAALLRPEVECWLAGGVTVLVLCSVYDCVDRLYSTCVDRIMARRDAAHMARTDVMTGLANRLAIQAELASACVGKVPFALLYVDLDGFKATNDGHGHAIGDALLVEVAARLRYVASDAVAARIGGDEFGVLQRADKMSAIALANLVVEHLSLPYYIDGRILKIGASVGIAFGTGDADEPAALLQQADEALYHAKASGKGQWKAGPERQVA